MSFKDIFCQDKAISLIQQGYASGRLAHAFIFAGMEGVGKFRTARELGKLLLCKEPVIKNRFADSCGKCVSCEAFEAGTHPDFLHIYKELLEFTEDGKDKKTPKDLSIDVIREFVIKKVSIRPALSEGKVFVISEGERLNKESQNALLKVLEEPPGYCTIILLCTQPENLFATIRSRCRIIRFGPIAEGKIIDRLHHSGLDKKRSQYFARLAGGSIGDACRWAELESRQAETKFYEICNQLVGELAGCRYADCLELADRFLKESRETSQLWNKINPQTSKTDVSRRTHKTFIRIIISVLRDCLMLKVAAGGGLTNFAQEENIKKMSETETAEQLCLKIGAAYRTMQWVDSNINEKLIFHPLLLKVTSSDTMFVLQSQLSDV
jgi:DNA polymerase-3 subunit delta'